MREQKRFCVVTDAMRLITQILYHILYHAPAFEYFKHATPHTGLFSKRERKTMKICTHEMLVLIKVSLKKGRQKGQYLRNLSLKNQQCVNADDLMGETKQHSCFVFGRFRLEISARRLAILSFSCFLSVLSGELRDNTLKLGHNSFLSNPFQFIVRLSP
jgi:hypothetical protein